MKPAPFSYHAPTSVDEALVLLGELGDQGCILAGGQALLPLMNLRLARPKHLVDINPVAEIDYIRSEDGVLVIGACTRVAALERSREVAEYAPLAAEAAGNIAHPSVRNRGTVGGNIAYADPATELPAVLLAMDGEVVLASTRGRRTLSAMEFFRGPYATARSADELLMEVRLRSWSAGTGHAFLEFTRKHGSYALVGSAVLVHLDDNGRIDRAAISLCGVDETPVRASAAMELLVGNAPSATLFEEAASAAVSGLDPLPDVKASSAYRLKLARVYVRRALELATERARGEKL